MRRQLLAAMLVAAASIALAQKKDAAAPPTIEVTGVLADAKGPLANKIVRVGPLDAQGNILAIRGLGASSGQGTDPQATSDAQGRFSIVVARSFFRNQAGDSIGVRVSTDIGGGRMSTAHKVAVARFDSRLQKVELGRLVLEPLGAR